uniref:Ig-like domain-containing protein n=1 Tax=Denticeps clupeoides TaxID=299321 RepID=A0AAY4BRF2_9TELE
CSFPMFFISSFDPRFKVFTNGTLVVHTLTEKDEGDYLCIARNKIGDDYVPLRVNILAKPAKIEQKTLADQNIMHGSSLKIDCVSSGLPYPQIQWLEVLEAAEKPQLREPKTDSIPLTVGSAIVLNCSFKGSPPPQVTWILPNGSALMTGARLSKFFHRGDGALLISNPSLSEAGTYRCLGQNVVGLTERSVTLNPGRKPEIRNFYNTPLSVINGENLYLHCMSSGDPARLMWTLPSGVVLNRPQPSVYDRGSYICQATNEYGSALITVPVTVVAYPPRPAFSDPAFCPNFKLC